MPKLFSLAREDTEHVVVIACLETLQNVVNKLKQNSFYGGNLESMCSLIKDVFSNKVIFASLFLWIVFSVDTLFCLNHVWGLKGGMLQDFGKRFLLPLMLFLEGHISHESTIWSVVIQGNIKMTLNTSNEVKSDSSIPGALTTMNTSRSFQNSKHVTLDLHVLQKKIRYAV